MEVEGVNATIVKRSEPAYLDIVCKAIMFDELKTADST